MARKQEQGVERMMQHVCLCGGVMHIWNYEWVCACGRKIPAIHFRPEPTLTDSSIGRAGALHAPGSEFESPAVNQKQESIDGVGPECFGGSDYPTGFESGWERQMREGKR